MKSFSLRLHSQNNQQQCHHEMTGEGACHHAARLCDLDLGPWTSSGVTSQVRKRTPVLWLPSFIYPRFNHSTPSEITIKGPCYVYPAVKKPKASRCVKWHYLQSTGNTSWMHCTKAPAQHVLCNTRGLQSRSAASITTLAFPENANNQIGPYACILTAQLSSAALTTAANKNGFENTFGSDMREATWRDITSMHGLSLYETPASYFGSTGGCHLP
eukprot:242424-Chlamydomonas_euryale.AAC.4